MRPFSRSHARRPQDGFGWLRFDNTEPIRVSTALLLTCRRAYLETHSLPLLQTEQRFYCERGPSSGDPGGSRTDISSFVENLWGNPAPVPGLRQADLVRSVRLFTQQNWLEDSFPSFVSTSIWFANLEHLRITLRHGDWWDWERNATLRINPFKGNCYHDHMGALMRRDMSAEGGNVEFARGAWGEAFSHMSKLKTLTIDFETSVDKREEMAAIVAWALKWRFPLPNSQHLSTGGQPAIKMSWRSLLRHWSGPCEVCGQYVALGYGCSRCGQTNLLSSRRCGPQLLVWTCLWKRVRDLD